MGVCPLSLSKAFITSIMRPLRLSALFLLLASLASCASVGKLPTASSKPEITLGGASKQQALDALVAWSATKGQQVIATTEYSITTTGSMSARTSNNVLWDETVLAKTIYTPIANQDGSLTLYSQRFITYVKENSVSNNKVVASSSQTIVEEYNNQRAYEEMQIELEQFARFFESNRPAPAKQIRQTES
jgi:hypothetical protein